MLEMEMTVSLPPLPPLPEFRTLEGQPGALKAVRYTHDAMIDLIIANPWTKQREIAGHFGYTEGWVSQVFTSDSFQSRLAERKGELVDPAIRATIEDRFKALVAQSFEVLKRKLEAPQVSDDLALGVLNGAAKALGYGARAPMQINQNFVVQVPPKSVDSATWAKENSAPRGASEASSPAGIHGQSVAAMIEDAEIVSAGPCELPVPSEADRMLEELERAV
jgi:hypothetical protein